METTGSIGRGRSFGDDGRVNSGREREEAGTKLAISTPGTASKGRGEVSTTMDEGPAGGEDFSPSESMEGCNSNEKLLDLSSELLFKKKDVRQSRTQSFQSVLSSASLKSLKQQYVNTHQQQQKQQQPPQQKRTSSTISVHSNAPVKNFQSFIQAPVLSGISNFKLNGDNIEIGQQLPFHDNPPSGSGGISNNNTNPNTASSSVSTPNNEDSTNDQDTMMQQQKLTMNALRKLSLSPMPIINSEESLSSRTVSQKPSTKLNDRQLKDRLFKNTQPYQPAEVDLSSFASLTRQPNIKLTVSQSVPDNSASNGSLNNPASKSTSNIPAEETTKSTTRSQKDISPKKIIQGLPRLEEDQSDSGVSSTDKEEDEDEKLKQIQATQKYHNDMRQHQLQTVKAHMNEMSVPSSILPGSNPRNGRSGNRVTMQQPPQRPSFQPNQPRTKPNKKLQQINSLRSPMYVPAVLRMTLQDGERNGSFTNSPINGTFPFNNSSEAVGSGSHPDQRSPSNICNPAIQHTIQESMTGTSSPGSLHSIDSNQTVKSTESSVSPPVISPGPFSTLSKRKYKNILRQTPTRRHWQKDEAVSKCGIPDCNKAFNFFERRHHCRKCGGIYCKEHTSHYLYINHLAQFTTGGRGTLSKVCDNCIEEYNEFMRHEFGVNIHPIHPHRNLSSPHTTQSKNKQPVSDKQSSQIKSMNANQKFDESGNTKRNDQLVGSVPANWSWSSF